MTDESKQVYFSLSVVALRYRNIQRPSATSWKALIIYLRYSPPPPNLYASLNL
jgi:hypothetical protein